MLRKIAVFLAAAFIICSFSACTVQEIDELYSLPQPREEYLQLQALIDAEIAAGSEYSAPTAGSFRQSVQLTDLDGDGANEALAFLAGDEGAKICVYRKIGETYSLALSIMGDGSGCGRVEYADLDGDGISEIMVSWRVSGDMRLLKAYSIKSWASTVLFRTSCTDFQIGDFNMDGAAEIAVLKFEAGAGSLDMYSLDASGEIFQSSAKLSASLMSIDRFRVGAIDGGIPALFVEGQYTDEENTRYYLTDIIISVDGKLKNIALSTETGDSTTKRRYQVYCTDINSDGVMDVPLAEKMLTQPGSSAESYVFDWYSYSIGGERALSASTYHCEADGWYIILPEQWREGFTVRRETNVLSGERAVVLSQADADDNISDLLTIYALSGENKRDRAKIPGRFVLLQGETVIYAARLTGSEQPSEEQRRDLTDRFHLIYTEWNTGAL